MFLPSGIALYLLRNQSVPHIGLMELPASGLLLGPILGFFASSSCHR